MWWSMSFAFKTESNCLWVLFPKPDTIVGGYGVRDTQMNKIVFGLWVLDLALVKIICGFFVQNRVKFMSSVGKVLWPLCK
jgi:hypothetical protein